MKKRLKILSLVDIPWNSGLTDYALKQAMALRAKGHNVFFAAPKNTLCRKTIAKAGFEILPLYGRKKHFIPPDILRIRRFVQGAGVNIINTHTGRTQTIALVASLRNKGTKVFRTKADARKSQKNPLTGRLAKIICASDVIRRNCLAGGFKEKILKTIHPPAPDLSVPLPKFSGKMTIGMLARLDPVKGHKTFLEAASILLEKGADCEFSVGGYESSLKYSDLRALAEKIGIESKVKFAGKINKPADFIAGCDMGVIPSTGSEAVSRVLMEWMAAGRPVIAANVGCIPEILGEKYLVPPEKPDLMADKIFRLLNSAELFAQASLQNKKLSRTKYGFEDFAGTSDEIFRDLNE